MRNAKFSPQGLPTPIHHPKNRRHPTDVEEKHLRALGPPVNAYLEFALPEKGIARHHLVRQLLALSRKMSADLFLKSLERALKYRITSLEVIERIAYLYLQQGAGDLPLAQVDEAFRQREAYLEGSLTEPPDLSIYQDPPEPPPPTQP